MPRDVPEEFPDGRSNHGKPIEDNNNQGRSDKGFDAANEHNFLSIFTIRNVLRVVSLEKSAEEMLVARFWFQVKEGD